MESVFQVQNQEFDKIIQFDQNKRVKNTEVDSIYNSLKQCNNYRSLKILLKGDNFQKYQTMFHLLQCIQYFKGLENLKLEIGYNNIMDGNQWDKIVQLIFSLKQLKQFEFILDSYTINQSFSQQDLQNICSNINKLSDQPPLSSFSIKISKNVFDSYSLNFIFAILDKFKDLKQLNLEFGSHIFDNICCKQLALSLKNLIHLESLNLIIGENKIRNKQASDLLESISCLSNLKHLSFNVNGVQNIVQDGNIIKQFLSNLSELTSIQIELSSFKFQIPQQLTSNYFIDLKNLKSLQQMNIIIGEYNLNNKGELMLLQQACLKLDQLRQCCIEIRKNNLITEEDIHRLIESMNIERCMDQVQFRFEEELLELILNDSENSEKQQKNYFKLLLHKDHKDYSMIQGILKDMNIYTSVKMLELIKQGSDKVIIQQPNFIFHNLQRCSLHFSTNQPNINYLASFLQMLKDIKCIKINTIHSLQLTEQEQDEVLNSLNQLTSQESINYLFDKTIKFDTMALQALANNITKNNIQQINMKISIRDDIDIDSIGYFFDSIFSVNSKIDFISLHLSVMDQSLSILGTEKDIEKISINIKFTDLLLLKDSFPKLLFSLFNLSDLKNYILIIQSYSLSIQLMLESSQTDPNNSQIIVKNDMMQLLDLEILLEQLENLQQNKKKEFNDLFIHAILQSMRQTTKLTILQNGINKIINPTVCLQKMDHFLQTLQEVKIDFIFIKYYLPISFIGQLVNVQKLDIGIVQVNDYRDFLNSIFKLNKLKHLSIKIKLASLEKTESILEQMRYDLKSIKNKNSQIQTIKLYINTTKKVQYLMLSYFKILCSRLVSISDNIFY